MKNIDVEVYISQMINFFEKNPGDFMDLVGEVQKEEFYQKMKEKSLENVENGEDYILTKQQIIDIVVKLKSPELSETINFVNKVEKHILKTKFGNIINIIAQREIIPELIQDKCNSDEIYKKVKEFIDNEILRKELVIEYTKILQTIIVSDSLEKISNYVIE